MFKFFAKEAWTKKIIKVMLDTFYNNFYQAGIS